MIRASDLIAGRYRLENPIPGGTPGEVWQATDLIQGRPVVVTLLSADQAEHTHMLERFRQAAAQAQSVSHPSVAQVFDHGVFADGEDADGRSPYLVAELVEAPSLAGLLAAGPLEPARVMDVLAQAASGLQAAHAAGLVHGGITPANLLVSPDGQVKITDFVMTAAEPGSEGGSPADQPPERAEGGSPTPASDLYSLGVVGYECLTGAKAFARIAARSSARRGRSLPPLPRTVPAAVAGLIDDLTARDPAKRPVSAEKVSVRAGLLRDTLAKAAPGRRNRRAHDVPTPAPTLTDGQTAVLSVAALSASQRAPSPGPAPGRRRSGRRLLLAGAGAVLAAGLAGWLLATAFKAPPRDPSRPGAPASAPSAAASGHPAGTVQLSDAAQAGQPVAAVTSRLRQLGLRPRVVWAIDSLQRAGTVITVQPSGRVPVGSVVTVTAALAPPARHHSG